MIPQGWLLHPQAAGWMYNPLTGQCVQVPEQAPQAPAIPQTMQQQVAQSNDPAHFEVPTAELYKQALEHANIPPWKRDSDDIWLRMPELKIVGQSVNKRIRILPNIHKPAWWAEYPRHRVPREFAPVREGQNPDDRKIFNATCPGQNVCPICAVSRELMDNKSAEKLVREVRAKTKYLAQVIDLDDVAKHWQQLKDENGTPLIGADGQPQYRIVPMLMEIPMGTYKAILNIGSVRAGEGDISHPQLGRNFVITMTKEGPEAMNVKYSVIDESRSPIDPMLLSILNHRKDPEEIVKRSIPKLEKLEEVAQSIRARFRPIAAAPPTAPQGYAPPVPQAGGYLAVGAPPMPGPSAPAPYPGMLGIPPQAPPPPPMAVPPAMPQMAPPPPPGALQGLPMNLPPPAPMMTPPLPPGAPGAPPPPPGMPAGLMTPVAPPLPAQPSGMTQQAFEGQFAPSPTPEAPPTDDDNIPFDQAR